MALDVMKTAEIIETLENFIEKKRPPVEIRPKLDISYKIENQSVIIFEIRPRWNNPAEYHESAIAKTTFIHTKQYWKIFWMRADLKWHNYKPKPTVKYIQQFLDLVEEDKYGCFWG
jgi:hypothetical protein